MINIKDYIKQHYPNRTVILNSLFIDAHAHREYVSSLAFGIPILKYIRMIKALLLPMFLLVGFVLGASYGVAMEHQDRSIKISDCIIKNLMSDKTGYDAIICILKGNK